ncbi:MAG TPA: tripartite tricarboxylate transporter substrate binding protein [Quisquiliibacterium sp.]|nr:MAG: tripartite tricarboxylate transporter substrate binding protein [Burkholderiaceae bacterium]HOA92392.1 tripartite tricarboxylate transporter substrate binding protein [Quisquiliibacterium sp.]HPA91199.1 tripartite tricarboxylate transporter substrate binding protein [Quisquiliibacterium sp.]HQD82122.1 tripartite tricarboxylate transporter substrate binding protein [Quisquiliibacterium sp.]HQN13705.1 tripartite tricarboxylate transporter substrate binding protein [Quisquiliibacterium sp.
MFNALRSVTAALVLATVVSAAHAQGFPSRTVRLIVPFPPGGTTDILAREVGAQLAQKWGVPVTVDNKAGASGTIGSQDVQRSAPDGHTLMITATHHVINPSMRKTLPYDTKADFTSLALIAVVPNVLVVSPGFAPATVAELIRVAKDRPGAISFGSTGIGGANHLSGELFKAMAGVDMVHVPYKGAAPALNDLLGGQIPVMFDSVPGVLPHIRSGKLRALGVTTKARVASLPEVPTIDEAGVRGFEATAWFGMYGPRAMPAELAARINRDTAEVLAQTAVREKLGKLGAEPGAMTQPAFAQFVDAEIDKWGGVVRRAGIQPE